GRTDQCVDREGHCTARYQVNEVAQAADASQRFFLEQGSRKKGAKSVAGGDGQRRGRRHRCGKVHQESAAGNDQTNMPAKNQNCADGDTGRGPEWRDIAVGKGYGKAHFPSAVVQEQNNEGLESTFPRILDVQLHGETFEPSILESTFFLLTLPGNKYLMTLSAKRKGRDSTPLLRKGSRTRATNSEKRSALDDYLLKSINNRIRDS